MTNTLTTTQHAANLRSELKRHGWTSRDISVRADYFSMGSAIDVRVKNPDIPLDAVKALAGEHESIRRCDITGEILSGGNRYLSVEYSHEAEAILAARWLPALQQAATQLDTMNGSRSLIEIPGAEGLRINHDGYRFMLWDETGHVTDGRLEDLALRVGLCMASR